MIPWGLIGGIATPLLAVGLGYVWVEDFLIIRDLRLDVTRVEKERDAFSDEIHNPMSGWVVRFQASERNNVTLRGAITEQNRKLDEFAMAQLAREEYLARQLAAAQADADRFDAAIVSGLNRRPQGTPSEIARQALAIVLDSAGMAP